MVCVFIAVEMRCLLTCVICVEEELKMNKVEWVLQGPVEHCMLDTDT